MTLSDYIKQIGREAFCKKFKVKERTAYSWELLDRYPNKAKAQEIVRKSPVTFDGIYGVTKPRQRERVAA
jgi:hypothetical protein